MVEVSGHLTKGQKICGGIFYSNAILKEQLPDFDSNVLLEKVHENHLCTEPQVNVTREPPHTFFRLIKAWFLWSNVLPIPATVFQLTWLLFLQAQNKIKLLYQRRGKESKVLFVCLPLNREVVPGISHCYWGSSHSFRNCFWSGSVCPKHCKVVGT